MEYFTTLLDIEEFLKSEDSPPLLPEINLHDMGPYIENGFDNYYSKERSDSENSKSSNVSDSSNASDLSICLMSDFQEHQDVKSLLCKTMSTRKRKMASEPKACAVCEAPTQYSHYGVPSCFACKIFFRRMVLSETKNKCKYNPNCDIFGGLVCQSCRFDKCLLVGMNPRVIQFPTNTKAIEIVDYLTKRKQTLEEKFKPTKISAITVAKKSPTFENSTFCYEIDSLLYLESKVRQLRESSYNPTFFYDEVSEILLQPCELANSGRYEKPLNWPINMDDLDENYDYVFHELNAFSKRYKRNWLVIDIILTIEAVKTLPVYQKLCFDDKTKLLERVAIINAKLMEYFYTAQNKLDALAYPDGFVPIKLIIHTSETHEPSKLEYNVFCRNPDSVIRLNMTTTEYVLLKSIIYCYSAIPDLTEHGRILLSEQRELYAKMLMKHLQATLGESEGAKRYLEILSLIPRLFQISEHTRQYWIQMELARRNHMLLCSYALDIDEPISELLDRLLVK